MNPKNDKLFSASLIAVIAIYAVVAQVAQFSGGFLIPDFNFAINSNKPDETAGYVIQFTELDGRSLDAPQQTERVVESLGGEFTWSIESLINRLGIAYFEGDSEGVELLRVELETVLATLGLDSAEYQLVWRVMNPVEKYNLGSFEIDKVLATFIYQPG